MMTRKSLVQHLGSYRPKIAIILGSGLNDVAMMGEEIVTVPYHEIAGFPIPTVAGHRGNIMLRQVQAQEILFLQGRLHFYETGNTAIMAPIIAALALCDIANLIVTNAAGSLHTDMPPGSLMLIRDHINLSGFNPLIGQSDNIDFVAKNFVALNNAYDDALCAQFRTSAAQQSIRLYEGIYVCFSGPSFETPAEARMARILGGDAVGMSTVAEIILARKAGLRTAALSALVNYGAALQKQIPKHDDTNNQSLALVETMRLLLNGFINLQTR